MSYLLGFIIAGIIINFAIVIPRIVASIELKTLTTKEHWRLIAFCFIPYLMLIFLLKVRRETKNRNKQTRINNRKFRKRRRNK